MNDFVEGKCTLPYIYLYHAMDEQDRHRLVSLHTKELSSEDAEWIKANMKHYQTIEKSFALAQKLSNEAQVAMKDDEELVAILETMIKRSY